MADEKSDNRINQYVNLIGGKTDLPAEARAGFEAIKAAFGQYANDLIADKENADAEEKAELLEVLVKLKERQDQACLAFILPYVSSKLPPKEKEKRDPNYDREDVFAKALKAAFKDKKADEQIVKQVMTWE